MGFYRLVLSKFLVLKWSCLYSQTITLTPPVLFYYITIYHPLLNLTIFRKGIFLNQKLFRKVTVVVSLFPLRGYCAEVIVKNVVTHFVR